MEKQLEEYNIFIEMISQKKIPILQLSKDEATQTIGEEYYSVISS